jgi:adenylate kinase family enzyme
MRILISGIPGTGKTFMGNYFHDQLGYDHIDMESGNVFEELKRAPSDALARFISGDKNLVVTGGFMVTDWAFQMLRQFIAAGFSFIWFDGDRRSARREFAKRGTVPLEAFDAKIAELDGHYDKIMALNPKVVNPFNPDNAFKTPDLITEEILR